MNFGTQWFQTVRSRVVVTYWSVPDVQHAASAILGATPLSFNPRLMASCSGIILGFGSALATVSSTLRAAQRVHFSPVIYLLFLFFSPTGNNHQHNAFTAFSPLPNSPPLSHQTYHPHPLNNHYPYFTFALLNIFTLITHPFKKGRKKKREKKENRNRKRGKKTTSIFKVCVLR